MKKPRFSRLKLRYEQNRYRLLLNVTGVVGLIILLKLVFHYLGWEVISVNPLFSGVVAANVFLMSFLLNGVLSDYKESERLPGELAISLETLAQDIRGIRMANPEANTMPVLNSVEELGQNIMKWFYKETRTSHIIDCLNEFTPHFAVLEQWTQANLIARLKQEQCNLRRTITRIHTIRETSFIESGYMLAYVFTFSLCLGLVLLNIEPFHESLFYVTVIAYFIIFLLLLIRDLDNPFDYYNPLSGEDVSLKPLEDALERLRDLVAEETLASGVKALPSGKKHLLVRLKE